MVKRSCEGTWKLSTCQPRSQCFSLLFYLLFFRDWNAVFQYHTIKCLLIFCSTYHRQPSVCFSTFTSSARWLVNFWQLSQRDIRRRLKVQALPWGCLSFSQKIRKLRFEVKWKGNFSENLFGNCKQPPEVVLFFRSEWNSRNALTICENPSVSRPFLTRSSKICGMELCSKWSTCSLPWIDDYR